MHYRQQLTHSVPSQACKDKIAFEIAAQMRTVGVGGAFVLLCRSGANVYERVLRLRVVSFLQGGEEREGGGTVDHPCSLWNRLRPWQGLGEETRGRCIVSASVTREKGTLA